MKLIVGLGNPGSKYQLTRHNIGFLAIDAFAEHLSARNSFREEHKALTLKTNWANQPVLLAKPQTFMNLSGESVRPLMDFYKIPLENVLVLHDEVDLPFTTLRFQIRRGHGGHNGIRSLHQHLGGDNYGRLKMGVGRPADPRFDVADYVLSNFSKEDMPLLGEMLATACEAVEYYLVNGLERAANKYNAKNASDSGKEP